MAQVFGIDLGTTYSAISRINDQGMPEIIENYADSTPFLASAVYFPEGGGDPVVGNEAKAQAEIYPERVVQFIKREIGKPDALPRNFDGVEYDPVTISSLILKRMKEYAEEQGYEVRDVVITCPAYFKTEERMATKQAGQIAGLNVLNIVNEPTAAALNYCLREFSEDRKILVYDLGGGTFDVTIVEMSAQEGGDVKIKVLKSDGDDRLGGIDWDDRLYKYICELYADENGIGEDEMDQELRQQIRSKVEDTKKSLSNMASRSFTINYGGATRIEVTAAKFEELTKDLVDRTVTILQRLLQDAGLTPDGIDTVLLVGGSTKMPMIKKVVDEMFPGAGKVRRADPDLAVAKGASLAAAIEWNVIVDKMTPTPGPGPASKEEDEERKELEKKYGKITTEDVVDIGTSGTSFRHVDILPCSFGPAVFTAGGKYMIDNLLFKDDESPAEATRRYQTMRDNQSGVQIPIYENVSTDRENSYVTPTMDENDVEQWTDPALMVKYLGVVQFELPAGTPGGSPIEVTFNYSTGGLLVTAVNISTGERFPVQILSPNTKSEEEIAADTKRISSIHTTGQV